MTIKSIRFTKMHGLGNDFVVINTLNQAFDANKMLIKRLANRHVGIGFDQLLLIEAGKNTDFFCRIYNSDGSEAEQCGNGLRCVARYLHENKLISSSQVTIATKAGAYPIDIKDYDHISVSMGAPQVNQLLVPIHLPHYTDAVSISTLSLGNPHAITKVDSVDVITLAPLSEKIAAHAMFPEGVNVGFMQIINPKHIRLRTFERGAGETNACGSNACAAAIAGMANGWLQPVVEVEFKYGSLFIEWQGENQPILMTGPASYVYEGSIN